MFSPRLQSTDCVVWSFCQWLIAYHLFCLLCSTHDWRSRLGFFGPDLTTYFLLLTICFSLLPSVVIFHSHTLRCSGQPGPQCCGVDTLVDCQLTGCCQMSVCKTSVCFSASLFMMTSQKLENNISFSAALSFVFGRQFPNWGLRGVVVEMLLNEN